MLNIDDSLVSGKTILVDTNFYRDDHEDFLHYLYQFQNLSEVDTDKIIDQINLIRIALSFVKDFDVKTIPEVPKEMIPYLDSLNDHLLFQKRIQKEPSYSHFPRFNNEFKRDHSQRLKNERIESIRHLKPDQKTCEQYRLIQRLAKDQLALITELERRDVTGSFSDKQKSSYINNLAYFRHLSKVSSVHRDLAEKYDKPRGKSSNSVQDTDEKLVSAAFALALKEQVCVISKDTDLKRMINYCRNGGELKYQMGFIEPVHNVELLLNFEDARSVKFTSYFN